MNRQALISSDGHYRYSLSRMWGEDRRRVLFIGLNPSTADAEREDNTCRRCISFAQDWGCDALLMGNLYALRATNPRVLATDSDPVGPENDELLYDMMLSADVVVAAWGAHPLAAARVPAVVNLALMVGTPLHCLGTTRDGHPRHPLYVPRSQELILWGQGVVGVSA